MKPVAQETSGIWYMPSYVNCVGTKEKITDKMKNYFNQNLLKLYSNFYTQIAKMNYQIRPSWRSIIINYLNEMTQWVHNMILIWKNDKANPSYLMQVYKKRRMIKKKE